MSLVGNGIRSLFCASFFLFGVFSLHALPGQSPSELVLSQPTLRTNTRLVLVDVVATDGKGQAIRDLRVEDFRIFENGRPQRISNFTSHLAGQTVLVNNTQLSPTVVSNAPQFQASSLNVILFDVVNGDFAQHAYAKEQLLKFLSTAKLGEPLAIFALQSPLKLLHDFTTDSNLLQASVQAYKQPAISTMTESVESRASAFSNVGNYHANDQTIETTLNELNALAKILKGYPGRKNLIWLSASFPLDLMTEDVRQNGIGFADLKKAEAVLGPNQKDIMALGGASKNYFALVKKVSDELMDAQIAVYPVDASALGRDEHSAAQHTMSDMAAWTGGRAFTNSNDLARSISTGINDGSTYYTLEYYPDNKDWTGQFRSIRVETSCPGVKLRHRLGYYALDPKKLVQNDADALAETVSRALALDTPVYTAVHFQAGVVPPSDKNRKVVVNFAIDPHTIMFQQTGDGLEHARVGCIVWAYGKNKDKPMTFKEVTQNAALSPGVYQSLIKQYFPCKREIDLKPGSYMLRLAVIDRTTNLVGTANAEIIVP